jgi:phospholipid/cholesterol/gamma-HCH transport system substrate-binding protein
MNERKFQFRVGIAVLLATLVIAGVLMFLVGDRPMWPFTDQYQLQIRFPEASGVQPGTPVRKFGKLIGRVDSVEIIHDGVLVTVSIDKNQRLPASDVPEVSSSLIGGDAVIEFVSRRRPAGQEPRRLDELPDAAPPAEADGGAAMRRVTPSIQLALFQQPAEEPTIQPGATIEGAVRPNPMQILIDMQGNLEETIVSLGDAGDAVARVANRVDEILAGADIERLRRIVAQTEQALGSFNETMDSINNVLGDEALQAQLRQGLTDLPAAVAEFRDTMNDVGRAATSAEQNLKNLEGLTGPIGERGEEIANSLQSAVDNLDMLLEQVGAVTKNLTSREGTLGQLLYNRELYDDVARVINNVEFLTEQLRPIVRDMQTFSNKIARDPSRIGVGGAIRREAPIK